MLKSLNSNNLSVESFRFSTYTIIQYANSDGLVSFFLLLMSFVWFSCLITLVWTFKAMLNRSVDSDRLSAGNLNLKAVGISFKSLAWHPRCSWIVIQMWTDRRNSVHICWMTSFSSPFSSLLLYPSKFHHCKKMHASPNNSCIFTYILLLILRKS